MSKEGLNDAIASIEKKFGKEGTIFKLSESKFADIQVISTGVPLIDYATGIWGLPKGRFVELYGGNAGGKSSCAMSTIAQAQKKGAVCAYIDTEHAFSKYWFEILGGDCENLLISQPDYGEQALEVAEALLRTTTSDGTPCIDVLVIDSIAALTPKSEMEGDMGDSKIGLHARLMSQAYRKLTPVVAKSNALVIMINQTREKIGGYGNPTTTTGGNATKFYSSLRAEFNRSEAKGNMTIDDDGNIASNGTFVKIQKNKLAPPYMKVDVPIYYDKGYWVEEQWITIGELEGVVTKRGSHYSFGDIKLGQGKKKSCAFLEENPEVLESIIYRIKVSNDISSIYDDAMRVGVLLKKEGRVEYDGVFLGKDKRDAVSYFKDNPEMVQSILDAIC